MVAIKQMALVGATALALLVANATALGTNYIHDGTTTYCWAIPRPTRLTNLTEADRTTAFSTPADCPLSLTVALKPANTVNAFFAVNVTWTVQADFSGGANAINNTRLYFGPDSTDRSRTAQIVHSNVHSCVFGTGCDPFSDGKQLVDKTVNKIANFTDNKASFSDSLLFSEPGEYSVLAHIILPNFNASSRFDYAVYTKLTVLAAAAPTTAPSVTAAPAQEVTTAAPAAAKSSSSSGLSQGATIAIIVAAVVVVVALAVVVVILRRRRSDGHHSSGYTPAPVSDAGHGGGGSHGAKTSGITDTNSTTGFQSAVGDTYRPTANYPYDRPSSDFHDSQYAPPKRAGFEMGPSSYPYSNRSSEPTNAARKKRVDSDVEL